MAIMRIKSTHQPSQGDFVEIEEENFDPAIHEVYGETKTTNIPQEWESMHWKQRVGLARQLAGNEEITSDQANEIIAAEVAKRR
jgi:hypothetical protein